MRVLTIILMYFFIRESSESSAYNIKGVLWQSKDLYDKIVRFDAQGNTYFWGSENLYRISPSELNAIEGEFMRTRWHHFRDDIVVSNRGDVFLMDNLTLRVVMAGSRKSQKVAESVMEYHVDTNGNLFYVRGKTAFSLNYTLDINLIRPYSAAPIQILNSSDFRRLFYGSSEFIKSDKSGNVYMAMHFSKSTAILLLTNETLQEEKPVAKYVNITETEELREIYDFMIDDENNLWILCSGRDSAVVMKLINDTWTEILLDRAVKVFGFNKSKLLNIKGRIYVVAQNDLINCRSSIYYIASNDKAIKLTGSDLLSRFSPCVQWTADDEGQIYFYNDEKMLTLKPNETQLIPIQIEESVRFAAVDWKNDVWITVRSNRAKLYRLKKGETIPELMDSDVKHCFAPMTSMVPNFVTKSVYLLCASTVVSIDNIN